MKLFDIAVIGAVFIVCTVTLAALFTLIYTIACWVFKNEIDITPENDKEFEL